MGLFKRSQRAEPQRDEIIKVLTKAVEEQKKITEKMLTTLSDLQKIQKTLGRENG